MKHESAVTDFLKAWARLLHEKGYRLRSSVGGPLVTVPGTDGQWSRFLSSAMWDVLPAYEEMVTVVHEELQKLQK